MVEMPYVPPQYAQVMIVQTSQAQRGADKTDRIIGVCSLVENPIRMEGNQYSAINSFGPIGAARLYFQNVEHREVLGPGLVTVFRNPQHGTLEPMGVADTDYEDKRYCPNGDEWKISLNPDYSNGGLISFQHLK
jgi:alpha-D-ribose 1-methylphosphonate 5-phosphate C-P lyase